MSGKDDQSKMRLAAVTLALPRLEWPFVDQWCRYLGRHGVQKLYLGVDETVRTSLVWKKKPNPKYYHLELSGEEIRKRWDVAVERSRCAIEVETIPIVAQRPIGKLVGGAQKPLFHQVRQRALDESFDWVLSCDMDEYPVVERQLSLLDFLRDFAKRRPDVAVIRMRQQIFESRWDAFNDCAPRALHQPCAYNPTVVRLTKYLYQPRHARPAGPHAARPETDGYRVAKVGAHRMVIHHFRGIEKAFHGGLSKIKSLPARTSQPLDPVPLRHPGDSAKDANALPTAHANGKPSQGIWVLSYPRTGSYFLSSILNLTGLDPPLDEYFHPKRGKIDEFPLNNKVHPRQFRRRARRKFGELLRIRPQTKFIVLRRRDVVAATVSCFIARRTGVWQVKNANQRRRLQRTEPVAFDEAKLLKLYHQRLKDDLFWTNVCERHGIRPLTLYYEDLAADPVEAAERAFRFLNLDADPVACAMRSTNVRQSSYREETDYLTDRLRSLVANTLQKDIRRS